MAERGGVSRTEHPVVWISRTSTQIHLYEKRVSKVYIHQNFENCGEVPQTIGKSGKGPHMIRD